MIFSIGEALIDKKNGKEFVGGGPLNVALAIARLNTSSAFIGGVSSDDYGKKILEFVVNNCIIFDPNFCSRKEPSMTAGVSVKDGKEDYEFNFKGTAAFFMNYELLEKSYNENSDINAIFYGSVTYTNPLCSNIILDFVTSHKNIVNFFDPNIRTKAIEDFEDYKNRITKACKVADIVKLSEDDLKTWGISESELFKLCKHHLIVTKGKNGATWYSKDFGIDKSVSVDGLSVPVKDTIGCGDCFSGAILHWLDVTNNLKDNSLKLTENDIYQALFFAISVSALNATREGCNPPTLEELQ